MLFSQHFFKNDESTITDDDADAILSAAIPIDVEDAIKRNNKESKVAKLAEDKRMYHLLEHVGTKPNVVYHVKVRNT